MSKVISFTDLRLIDGLSHLREIEMLHPSNDDLMLYYLDKFGMDIQYPVEYIPSKHRNLQNKIVLGFQAVGDLQCNRAFVNSYLCSTVERVAISSYQDRSLTTELANLMNNTLDFSSFNDPGDDEEGELTEDQLQPDWAFVAQQISQLEGIREMLRGPAFGPDGNPVSREQVKARYENQTFYEEKYL